MINLSRIFSGKTVHRVAIGYSQSNYRFLVTLAFHLSFSIGCPCSWLSFPSSPFFQVYLGLTDVTKLELAQLYEVETIIIHPGWNLLTKVRRPNNKSLGRSISQDNNILDGHDIALIRLTREVTLSDTVWPACLPGEFSRCCYKSCTWHTQSVPDPVLAPSLGDVGQEVTVVGFGTTNTTTKV